MGKRPIEKRAGTQGKASFVLCLSPEPPNHTFAISASPSKGIKQQQPEKTVLPLSPPRSEQLILAAIGPTVEPKSLFGPTKPNQTKPNQTETLWFRYIYCILKKQTGDTKDSKDKHVGLNKWITCSTTQSGFLHLWDSGVCQALTATPGPVNRIGAGGVC